MQYRIENQNIYLAADSCWLILRTVDGQYTKGEKNQQIRKIARKQNALPFFS